MPSFEDILKGIKLDYGSIRTGDQIKVTDRLPSGSPALDLKIGGGFPCGRMTTLVGDPATGKTTICLSASRQAAAQGKRVVWIDTEHKWDVRYAELCKVDPNTITLVNSSIEENIFTIERLLVSKEVGLVVWDSLAQGVSQRALVKDVTQGSFAASESAAYSRHWPRMLSSLEEANVPLLCTNQWRIKGIGGTIPTWRDQYGGQTVRYTPSLIIWLTGSDVQKRGDVPVGLTVKFLIKKSQVSLSATTGVLELDFDEETEQYGVSRAGDLFNLASDMDLVKKSGSWYSLEIEGFEIK